eukprot:6603056-Pyramimonas_sp.AAC.2
MVEHIGARHFSRGYTQLGQHGAYQVLARRLQNPDRLALELAVRIISSNCTSTDLTTYRVASQPSPRRTFDTQTHAMVVRGPPLPFSQCYKT